MTSVTHAIGAEVSDQISKCICSEKVLQDLANALHCAKLCTSRESGQGIFLLQAHPLKAYSSFVQLPSCFKSCFNVFHDGRLLKGAHLIILLNSVSVHASTPVSNCCQHLSYSEYLTILWGFSAPCGSMTMTFSGTSLSSFSCRSFFKFFQDPLHHNCHSVKIRSS